MRIPSFIGTFVCLGALLLAGSGVAEARIGFLWRKSKQVKMLPRPRATQVELPPATDIFPLTEPVKAPLVRRTLTPAADLPVADVAAFPLPRREARACYDEDFFEPVEVADSYDNAVASTVAVADADGSAVAEPEPDVMSAAVDALADFEGDAMAIFGSPQVSVDVMTRFAASRNPDFDSRIARAFHEVGRRYGIRGDIAFCQAIVETGWFMFTGGTAVRPSQHNYCGLGVLKKGMRGHSFQSVEEGVTAQIQHLYAYATRKDLPRGERLVDPRFNLVDRGCASTWHDLSNRWAANSAYGASIMNLYQKLLQFK